MPESAGKPDKDDMDPNRNLEETCESIPPVRPLEAIPSVGIEMPEGAVPPVHDEEEGVDFPPIHADVVIDPNFADAEDWSSGEIVMTGVRDDLGGFLHEEKESSSHAVLRKFARRAVVDVQDMVEASKVTNELLERGQVIDLYIQRVAPYLMKDEFQQDFGALAGAVFEILTEFKFITHSDGTTVDAEDLVRLISRLDKNSQIVVKNALKNTEAGLGLFLNRVLSQPGEKGQDYLSQLTVMLGRVRKNESNGEVA